MHLDDAQHRRFLSYLELSQYFVRKPKGPLDMAEFAALDQELGSLLDRERAGAATATDVDRIVSLRRELLRD